MICVAAASSAHFPKFVIHRSIHLHELRKAMGTSKLIDSSAAFLFEVPGLNSPLVVQELQIGGTSVVVRKFSSFPPRVRQENFRTKTTLESWISSVLSNPKFAKELAAKCRE